MLAIVNGMGIFRTTAIEILRNHGIHNPVPDQWYPQEAWLAAFAEIQRTIGSSTLRQIGLQIPDIAKFPPEINSIEAALSAIDVAYHMNHRGGEIGTYGFTMTGDRQGKMVCANPYPCDFDRGIIEAMAERFRPQGSVPVIRDDGTQPCRKTGGESCTYLITW